MFAPYASTCGWADQWAPAPAEPVAARERVELTPGTDTRYRVWLDGKVVCRVNDFALASALCVTIKRHLAAERVATVNAETGAIIEAARSDEREIAA